MYYHYTDKKNFELLNKTYKQEIFFKPFGLWLSKNDEWKRWCKNEDFMCNRIKYKYEFSIDFTNILIIATFDDLKQFYNEYNVDRNINWHKVVEKYDGILFDNYKKIKYELYTSQEPLSQYLFYCAVDVSSVCVWNISCLKLV